MGPKDKKLYASFFLHYISHSSMEIVSPNRGTFSHPPFYFVFVRMVKKHWKSLESHIAQTFPRYLEKWGHLRLRRMRWFAYMNVIILVYACLLCQAYINGGGSGRELIVGVLNHSTTTAVENTISFPQRIYRTTTPPPPPSLALLRDINVHIHRQAFAEKTHFQISALIASIVAH